MDSEETGDARDYVNVLDVFDGRADDSTEEALPANRAHAESPGSGSSANIDVNEENDTEAEEDAREEDEPDSMLSADEDVNPSALEGLEKFVSSLETSKKRKGDSNTENNPLPRKRRLMEERTAVGVEGEFTAVASSTLSHLYPTNYSQCFQASSFGWTICSHRWLLTLPQGFPLRKLSRS